VLGAGLIPQDTRSLKVLAGLFASIDWLSFETVLWLEEGRSLHEATHHIVVAGCPKQVAEGVLYVFAAAFSASLVGSGEQSAAGLRDSIAVLRIVLLSFAVADSTTVDATDGCKLGVLSQYLSIVIR